jgi:hypothetical protein
MSPDQGQSARIEQRTLTVSLAWLSIIFTADRRWA